MIQSKRHDAITNLIRKIELGDIPSIDHDGARIIFREQLREANLAEYAICGVPLIGRQEHFCSGHWDYAIVDVTLDQPYHRVLASLAKWLRENLLHPQLVRDDHYWLGVIKGAHTCEVCNRNTSFREVLKSDPDQWVKQHTVCDDHMSFRLTAEEIGGEAVS